MDSSGKIGTLVGSAIEALGYELVRIRLESGRRATLQIMAERRDRLPMKVEDCARISREISVMLDEADPIPGEYTLEVSSPGIDRPLMKIADYARFAGHEVRVELETPIDGRKRLQGVIAAASGDHIVIETEAGAVTAPFSAVKRAKLILTDRLIAAVEAEGATAESVGEATMPEIHV